MRKNDNKKPRYGIHRTLCTHLGVRCIIRELVKAVVRTIPYIDEYRREEGMGGC